MMKKIGLYLFFAAFCNVTLSASLTEDVCAKYEGNYIKDVRITKLSGFPDNEYSNAIAYVSGNLGDDGVGGYYTIDYKGEFLFANAKLAYLTKAKVDVCLRVNSVFTGGDELFEVVMK